MVMKMSKIESALRSALAYYQALNKHDIDAVVKLMSPDCTFESSHPAPDGNIHRGPEAISRYWQDLFTRYPQFQVDPENVYGFGKSCIGHWRCRWHDSEGQERTRRGVDLFREKDGLIYQILSYQKGNAFPVNAPDAEINPAAKP